MKNNNFVSIGDFSKQEILHLVERSSYFEQHSKQYLLKNKICAMLFFEPSTRTRLSFETAINRLEGKIIGFSDVGITSSSKGESLKDTIKIASNYADVIIMRHYLEGAARFASEITNTAIINAGDGANQHPSQTLLDIFSIYKTQGTLYDLTIAIVGDLKYGRTVHSLLNGMSHFNPIFYFISPEELKLPLFYKELMKHHGIHYVECSEFSIDIINQLDILYMTRIQRERFTDLIEYEKVKNIYTLSNSMLFESKNNLKILHPLPRISEISSDVDDNPKAYYFEQAKNGIFARQAIISEVLKL